MSASEIEDLKDASRGRVHLAVCDISKESAVNPWAASVAEELGEPGLDLLISNAGVLTPGLSRSCHLTRSAENST